MLRRTSSPYVSDITKGKSFNFSVWDEFTGYNNNALIQDFVSYDGALYACIKSVLAGDVNPKTDTADGTITGNYWMQVVKGVAGRDGKNGKDGYDGLSAYQLAVKKGFKGSEAEWLRSLAKQAGNIPMTNILLRVDTDPALFPDENYCGTHIQWKYDSEDYREWNNLIQINQLMNLALGGLNLNYNGIKDHDGKKCYNLTLDYNEIDYVDAQNNIKFGPKIRTISDVYIPIADGGDYVDPDQIAKPTKTTFVLGKEESCENYFYIDDPNNKGWTLTSTGDSWLTATPGGADTAFNYQEGLDSIMTPCETTTIDPIINGVGSTLVIMCVDENTTGRTRSCNLTFTSSGKTTLINVNQKSI